MGGTTWGGGSAQSGERPLSNASDSDGGGIFGGHPEGRRYSGRGMGLGGGQPAVEVIVDRMAAEQVEMRQLVDNLLM